MEESKTKILIEGGDLPNLHSTPSAPGQEYCAFTYLLIKDPKTPEYGIIKVLCTGPTIDDVQQRVASMMKSGQIEPEIPFVAIRRTGRYVRLIAGGDPKVLKEGVDVQTGQLVNEVKKMNVDKRKAEMKEMDRRLDELKESSEEKATTAPDPFEAYKYSRVQAMMAAQRSSQLEDEMKEVNKIKKKAANSISRIESQYGTFKKRFEQEMDTNRKAHKDQMEASREKLLKEQDEAEKSGLPTSLTE
jgi:hypothetical protein